MESKSRLSEWFGNISDWVTEQQWYQELKSKWDEVDPQIRTYIQLGAAAAGVLILVIFLLSSLFSVYGQKRELAAKGDLLRTMQAANAEIKRLKESTPSTASLESSGAAPWNAYLEGSAATAGIDKANLTISPEKSAGTPAAGPDAIKEVLFDVAIKHVSLRQLVAYTQQLENGPRPVKLRNLSIDTKSDPSGYMDATVAVSAFSLSK